MKKIIFSMLLLMITSLHAKGQNEPYDYNATLMIILHNGEGVHYGPPHKDEDLENSYFFILKKYINKHVNRMGPAQDQHEIEFFLNEPHYTFMLINPKQKQLIHLGEGWISDGNYWGTIPVDGEYNYIKNQIIEFRIELDGAKNLNPQAIKKSIEYFEEYIAGFAEEGYYSPQVKKSHNNSADLSASQKPVAHNQAIEEKAPIPANTNQSISNASSSYSKTYSSTSTSAFSSFTYSSIEAGRIVSDVPSKNPDNHPETDSNNQPTEQPLVSKSLLLLILGGCLILLIFFLRKKK